MRYDPGNRGLLANAPANPLDRLQEALQEITGVVILTGFPVRLGLHNFTGETDGPLGAANLAFAFESIGVPVWLLTDEEAYWVVNAAVTRRGCKCRPLMLPKYEADEFIAAQLDAIKPSHVLTIERPGKARDGHYHNMRGGIIDAMFVDASSIIEAARERGITTISIGDGGNEIGMGALAETIEKYVPHGEAICAREVADIALISGVSNWWGWGVSALLSRMYGINLLPSDDMERGMLHEMVLAGSVDGCTKKPEETVDNLPMEVHLGVLSNVRSAMLEK
ncbi:MAG: DUF4392 domain-containing protein [Selenomonadaceae bacterium]|nr:DUF4392 domain-containing protein [Selenomonadaceae bacterium]MBQ5585352.1 DUF4392 domain-containing protein [Selenomonadaceae bacterium]MBQ5920970.1 DUF4392 domain-containing protein [Selenomonadaceae bacterium]MBR0329619.1 DUF4392 domain-containing protein [Selenomonadaceae bacterium]MBR0359013.1 DUF4392 domain-containing protein [Selenomonadaceae bacterium]